MSVIFGAMMVQALTIREGGKLQEKRNYKLVSKWLGTSPCSGWTEGGEDELSTG